MDDLTPEKVTEWRTFDPHLHAIDPRQAHGRLVTALDALAAEKAAREEAERNRMCTPDEMCPLLAAMRARIVKAEQERDRNHEWWTAETNRSHAAEAAYAALGARINAGMAVTHEHRDVLTRRGKFPEREDECVCLGCQTYRALTEKEQGRG